MAVEEPDRIVVIDGDRAFSASEMVDAAHRLAGALLARGLEPGDVVSFQLPTWWEAGAIVLATAMAGLVANPIIPIYRSAELRHILADSGSRMLFIPSTFRRVDYVEMLRGVTADLERPPEIVVTRGEAPGLCSFDDVLNAGDPRAALPDVAADQVALLLYTSGTTGPAKGVLHTHESVGAMVSDQELYMGPWRDTTILAPSPVTHITGALQALYQPLILGARAVLMDAWDAAAAFELMKRHQCNVLASAPPFIRGLLDEAARTGEPLPALRLITTGGAGVAPSLVRECYAQFPNVVAARLYGCTELPMITTRIRTRDESRYGCETDGAIGRTRVRLLKPGTEAPVAEGEEGEVVARGAQMMLRYLRDEDNVAAFTSDGWFRTGDLARVIDGRYLLITGRSKDIIIRMGENLSPKEIEDALHNHPAIAAVAVVGMPDARKGEALCAYVVLRPGCSLELPEVGRFIAETGLAPQKTPERLEFVDELPLSPQGKVRKDLLRDMITAKLQAEAQGAAC
jgi:acyl-CoA synthetase (AMP-forming)/AMP-acid ligase II